MGAVTWNLSLHLYELARLGGHGWWWRLNYSHWRAFRGLHPMRIAKELVKQGTRSFAHGETYAVTVAKIIQTAALKSTERFVDLGSGRGLPALTAASLGFSSTGIEYIGSYVKRCNRVAQELALPARFVQGDLLSTDWPAGELYLISSTAFPIPFREALQEKLEQLPLGTKVVTQDWVLPPPFRLETLQVLPVTWGTAKTCYHRLGDQ